MRITLISFTQKSSLLCKRLVDYLKEEGHSIVAYSKYGGGELPQMEDNLSALTGKAFEDSNSIIFIGAAGIAVRAIAPFLKNKASDPAVIVINETGEYVIPILSGHLGGANSLAHKLASFLGGRAIITTATDINGVFSVDVWTKENGLHILNIENIKHISAALLNGQKIGFRCDFPVEGELPEFFTKDTTDYGIYIYDHKKQNADKQPFKNTLFLCPKLFAVGVGCRKGIPEEILEEVFLETLAAENIPKNLVYCVATIDIKKEEEAIIRLCDKFRYCLKLYTNKELMEAKGSFSSSGFVRAVTGVDNVCERAAILASNHGKLIMGKRARDGVTVAIAERAWRCSF
jgi:cobalt-precorrin 5A hydrolase